MASLVFTSFTYAGVFAKTDGVEEGNMHESDMNKDVAENKKAQPGATDFMKLGDIKGELHGSDMNKKNQAVEDRYRKVGSGVLINTENPIKGKPASTSKVWTDENATSIQKPACSLHDSVHC